MTTSGGNERQTEKQLTAAVAALGCLGVFVLTCSGCMCMGFFTAPSGSSQFAGETISVPQSEPLADEHEVIASDSQFLPESSPEQHELEVRQSHREQVEPDQEPYRTLMFAAVDANHFSVVRFLIVKDKHLVIHVANAWNQQTYDVRLNAARKLWALWAEIRSPDERDAATIVIVDEQVNQIGQSLGGYGSDVTVVD